MDTLAPISLNENWRYHFEETLTSDYSALVVNDAHWIPLSRLNDWSVAAGQPGADWFRREVTLHSTGECVNYLLRLQHIPEPVTVFINGQRIATVQPQKTYSLDVTHAVHLGDNVIALRVTGAKGGGGGFGGLVLIPVPCDPDTDLRPASPD